MKIQIMGWWFPVYMSPKILINSVIEAEKLEKFLKEMNSDNEACKVRRHIQDQIDGKYLKMDEYSVGEHEI